MTWAIDPAFTPWWIGWVIVTLVSFGAIEAKALFGKAKGAGTLTYHIRRSIGSKAGGLFVGPWIWLTIHFLGGILDRGWHVVAFALVFGVWSVSRYWPWRKWRLEAD